jgi:hypothetical protein
MEKRKTRASGIMQDGWVQGQAREVKDDWMKAGKEGSFINLFCHQKKQGERMLRIICFSFFESIG